MNEKALTVLEQYDLNIKGTYRTKGNYGCTTDEGKYLLMEYNNSNEKMVLMSTFYDYLEKAVNHIFRFYHIFHSDTSLVFTKLQRLGNINLTNQLTKNYHADYNHNADDAKETNHI